jgi:cell wall-associated NlpC family hydrolase
MSKKEGNPVDREMIARSEHLAKQTVLSDLLVQTALRYVGSKSIHYHGIQNGITVSEGFDCSGFITFLLNEIEYSLPENPRHCDEYFQHFGDFVHDELRRPGDLIFFSRQGIYPTHIGILISKDQYLHAPGHDDTFICTADIVYSPILKNDELAVKQIYAHNPIGYKRIIDFNNRLPTRK